MVTWIRTFYRRYKLVKDTPTLKAGTQIEWSCWTNTYKSGDESLKMETVERRPEWFEPLDLPEPYYASFPLDLDEHFHFGEVRHNQVCRFCVVARDVIDSDDFRGGVTELLRRLYMERIGTIEESS